MAADTTRLDSTGLERFLAISRDAVDAVTERFYAISAQRRLTHPAVVAITSSARKELFGQRHVATRQVSSEVRIPRSG